MATRTTDKPSTEEILQSLRNTLALNRTADALETTGRHVRIQLEEDPNVDYEALKEELVFLRRYDEQTYQVYQRLKSNKVWLEVLLYDLRLSITEIERMTGIKSNDISDLMDLHGMELERTPPMHLFPREFITLMTILKFTSEETADVLNVDKSRVQCWSNRWGIYTDSKTATVAERQTRFLKNAIAMVEEIDDERREELMEQANMEHEENAKYKREMIKTIEAEEEWYKTRYLAPRNIPYVD